MSDSTPLVSVVTPFYNTVDYLAECIESVLAQDFADFEYLLVDNVSTDGSTEVAEAYAARDSRIRFVRFEEHLPQLPNFNRALRLADRGARYCKMALADDVLLPGCLTKMVALADSDDDIGLVGAYAILQNRVFLDGLDFYESVVDGTAVCRTHILDGPYVLGSPTTCLYRMDDIVAREAFFPEDAIFADTDVQARLVIGRKFGFVHDVLSFVRTSNESIMTRRTPYFVADLTRRELFVKYGDRIFEAEERDRVGRRLSWKHHRLLGEGLLRRWPSDFWDLQLRRAAAAGIPINRGWIVLGALVTLFHWVANPGRTIGGLVQRAFGRLGFRA